jgi:ABC-2 type transport system permease protein
MLKIHTTILKELLLLLRDRTGLLVLFLMPAVLVVVITLVQENVMELTGQKKSRVVLLDQDRADIGESLQQLLATGNLEVVVWQEDKKDATDVRSAVNKGDFQAGIILGKGSSTRSRAAAADLFRPDSRVGTATIPDVLSVQVFFDPGIMAGLRTGIAAQLRMALTIIAMELKLEVLDRLLKEAPAGSPFRRQFMPLPASDLSALLQRPLLVLEEQSPLRPTATAPYNPVQQNVPAWALFGMFFTAIPIAGALLNERTSGIWIRLQTLPVSPLVLIGGKVAAYIGVCLCQFLLIALIGAYLFPRFGLPAFTISPHPTGVLLAVVFSSLAACGYGIFLGMICNSYEQASTLGATTVVAAAAIGGVMVPVYAMPDTMQRLSIISPLNWGLTAFHDLILRGYSLPAVLDDLGRLLLFFAATALLSWKLSGLRRYPAS